MKTIILSLLIMAIPVSLFAQWPAEVKIIQGDGSDSVVVQGDLASGKIISDLTWASSSSNACFVALQNAKFRGNHVFYATTIPPHSIMKITVKPENDAANLSMYAYMSVIGEHYLVPDLPKCITCEADFKWDRPWRGKTQNSERMVEFNNPTGGPFNILVGVSAPAGVTSGRFALKIKTTS